MRFIKGLAVMFIVVFTTNCFAICLMDNTRISAKVIKEALFIER